MREPTLGVAVGKKGVGKTYTTNQVIQQYVRGNPKTGAKPRRVLILDVNDEFYNVKALALKDVMRFSAHSKIEVRRIRPFKSNGKKMTLRDIQQTLFKILEVYRNGLLLIEDINKYVSDSLPNDLVGAICTNRHSDTDIILHFQSIGRVTTKIWQNINWLRFHKNTDSVDRHRKKFEDKFEYLKIAEILVDKKYYEQNDKRYYLYVDIDNEKIRGNVSKKELDSAIEDYIGKYHKSTVRPLLNMVDLNGKKKYTHSQAVEQVKQRIYANFT